MASKIHDHRNQPIADQAVYNTAVQVLRRDNSFQVYPEVQTLHLAINNSQPEEGQPKTWKDVQYWIEFRSQIEDKIKENVLKLINYFQKHNYTPYS